MVREAKGRKGKKVAERSKGKVRRKTGPKGSRVKRVIQIRR